VSVYVTAGVHTDDMLCECVCVGVCDVCNYRCTFRSHTSSHTLTCMSCANESRSLIRISTSVSSLLIMLKPLVCMC